MLTDCGRKYKLGTYSALGVASSVTRQCGLGPVRDHTLETHIRVPPPIDQASKSAGEDPWFIVLCSAEWGACGVGMGVAAAFTRE
jgi:hypothetical protein